MLSGCRISGGTLNSITGGLSDPLILLATGSSALFQFDRAAKKWIGLIAYRLMGRIDALFPGP
jgi:hypothetical protein